jgi:uncharacterized protein YdeI (YjbR/CyaY-like superfamily)
MPRRKTAPDADGEVIFFDAPSRWRQWLARHHARRTAVWVGFRKRGSGLPSLTWPQSVDEALCFGWIDGVRKSIDETSYKIRFTPRKAGSTWSAVNIRRVGELEELGLMQPRGREAFAARTQAPSGRYSYEQRGTVSFDEAAERALRANAPAWRHFQSRPPWYRRMATFWVMSAKREETRHKRLQRLIADSAAERPIPPLAYGRK